MTLVLERLRTVRSLVALVFRSDPWRTMLALSPVIPLSSGLAYVAARELLRALAQSDNAAITRGAVLFAVAFVGTVWLGRVVRTTRIRLGELTVAAFNRRRVAAILAPPGIEHLQRRDYLDRLETIRSRTFEVGQVPRMLGWLVDSGGGIIVSAVLLITIEPLLALVVLGGAPPALVNARAQRRIDDVNAANAATNRRALHLYEVATRPADAKEIRVFNLRDELLSRYVSEWRAASGRLLRAEVAAGAIKSTGWLVQAGAFAAGVAYLIEGVQRGDVSAADVFVGLGAMAMVVGQFGQAAGGLSNIGRVAAVFHGLIDVEEEAARHAEKEPSEPPPARITDGIQLRNMSFRYPGASTYALQDVNLRLPAGSITAIVGDNGAGKSTLVKLLFGLYTPSTGSITVDGAPLADMQISAWRERTSACFQDYVKFELLAREAVGVGDLPKITDDAVVTAAVDRAGATDIIDALPEQLDSQLGPRFGGADLSGGQWQRLAISRAMMRGQPLVLALDEPTGALDPLAEQQIFLRYAALARRIGAATGAITILVSHRFSTVRMADQIVVLDNGTVREVGDHHELMARGDLYAELYELQAQHYR